MGKLIRIAGAKFIHPYILKTVDIPDEPIVPDVPDVPECEHIYDNACDTTCNLCGATRTVTHTYVDGFCSVCGKRSPDNLYTIAEYPVTDGLKGLYDLGGTAEATMVNHAPEPQVNDGDEELKSGCTVEDDYVTFSGTASTGRMLTYLRLPLTNGLTYVALFSVPSGNRPIISNRSSKAPHLALTATAVTFGQNAVTTSVGFDTPINSSNFVIVTLRATTNGFMVDRYTDGALNRVPLNVDGTEMNAYEGVVDTWSTNAIQIGGDSTSSTREDAHISLAAIHEGVMTDEQLESICQFVYNYGAQKLGEENIE